MLSFDIKAEDELNFDFLQGVTSIPSGFLNEIKYPEGYYNVNVVLNDKYLSNSELSISKKEQKSKQLCLSEEWLDNVGVFFKKNAYSSVFSKDFNCYELGSDLYTKIHFDHGTQTLHIDIPQAFQVDRMHDTEWDFGEDGAHLSYSTNFDKNPHSSLSFFGNVDLGINVGRWRLASDMNISRNGSEKATFSAGNITVSKPLKNINSDLMFGYSNTRSLLFSNFSFYGAALRSNRGMDNMESSGYAPVISGIADSPSRITVIQGGYTIHSEVVAQGPYKITNIRSVSNGDMTVTVVGDSGAEKSTIYPIATLPTLLRANDYNYNIVVGERSSDGVDNAFSSGDGVFALASLDYGFDVATLSSAAIVHSQYHSIGLGLTRTLGDWGSVEVQLSSSIAQYNNDEKIHGVNVGIKYAKSLSDRTDLQLLAYRYQTKGYVEFSEFDPHDVDHINMLGKRRSRYEARGTHSFDDLYLSASYWSQTYWDKDDSDLGANISMNGSLMDNRLSVTVNGSYIKNSNSIDPDYSISIGFSWPFDFYEQRLYNSSSVSNSNISGTSLNSSIYSTVNDRLNYNLGVNVNSQDTKSISASINYKFNRFHTNFAVSQSNDKTSFSGGLSGGVIATSKAGLLMTNQSSNTLAIVHIKDVEGVTFNQSLPTNDAGYTVVGLNEYSTNSISVNAENLPNQIELLNSSFNVTPTESTIIYREFKVESVLRYILRVREKKGGIVSSANALSETGHNVGFISNNGVLLVNVPTAPEFLTIYHNNRQCQINMGGVMANTYELQEVICE